MIIITETHSKWLAGIKKHVVKNEIKAIIVQQIIVL